MSTACHARAPRCSASEWRLLHLNLPHNVAQTRIHGGKCGFARDRRAPSLRTSAAASATAPLPAAQPEAPSNEEVAQIAASLTFVDLWRLMRPDWRLIAACTAATLVSVASFVFVAPCLGRVIDVISASGSTPRQLAIAVGTLGGVYICSNAWRFTNT